MGWKNIKQHYRIEHIVQMRDGDFHIGSPYISDIIVVNPNGVTKKRFTDSMEPLARYQREIDESAFVFTELLRSEDQFDNNIVVYTYKDDIVIEEKCEELGWPNLTHSGKIMYENTFSTDRDIVIGWMMRNAMARVELVDSVLKEREQELAVYTERVRDAHRILNNIEREYPEMHAAFSVDYKASLS